MGADRGRRCRFPSFGEAWCADAFDGLWVVREPRCLDAGRLYLVGPVTDMGNELMDPLRRHAELTAGFAAADTGEVSATSLWVTGEGSGEATSTLSSRNGGECLTVGAIIELPATRCAVRSRITAKYAPPAATGWTRERNLQ